MSEQETRLEIKSIADTIAKKYKPQKIILFGSFAYGKPNKASDIDMLIIKETTKKRIDRIKEVLFMTDNNVPFEPLIYTPKEIEDRISLKDYFIQTILNRGKVLYQN